MAKNRSEQSTKPRVQIEGMEEAVGTYADVFLVATADETKISNLYFFQSQISVPSIGSGTEHVGGRKSAQCIAHIVLSDFGLETLLQSLAENRGYILTKKNEEQE